jgi:prepilin-type processing-associated H-X9-DG protein/prepilin-type N-terminal cleavage/methylation domain-containing protein
MNMLNHNLQLQNREGAFTLVETLVVVAILAILLVLGLGPGIGKIKKNAAASKCTANLRQIGAAFYMYAGENNGEFPPVSGDSFASSKDDQDGKGQQWDQQLVPYLSIPNNTTKSPLKNTVYYCPESDGDPSYATKPVTLLSYTYNANVGKSQTSPGVRATGGADLSSVMLLADLQLATSPPGKSYVPQTGQGQNNTIVFRPVSSYFKFLSDRHNQKMNILFLDGHVAARMRINENDTSSPPEDVRWIPGGPLTGSR